jgi:2-polyprenyl-3-methyl-5-hydroxy-6-metoxy-1,4-benzoquinol methylase
LGDFYCYKTFVRWFSPNKELKHRGDTVLDKASRLDISLEQQRAAWNAWNAKEREHAQGEPSLRQAETVERWMQGKSGSILEIGCGAGWMADRLSSFGKVTAVDLADEVIARAQ